MARIEELTMTDLPDGADVAIIGSGMAGLAVAAELAEHTNASIVILEAGPDAGRAHIGRTHGQEKALNLWLNPESDVHFWRPYATDNRHYKGLSSLRKRVGGRSLYWGGALLPIEDWALYPDWPSSIASDLAKSWQQGPSLYEHINTEITTWAGENAVQLPSSLNLAGHLFVPTPHASRLFGATQEVYSPLQKAMSASRQPTIVQQCFAAGVITKGGKATGVKVQCGSDERDISASHVILAAGTIESSRLAIQTLADVGCQENGHLIGLVDKIAQGFTIVCRPSETDAAICRAAARHATFHRCLGRELRSNHFVRLSMREDGAVELDTWLMGEQERGSHGQVYCNGNGDWPWETRVTADFSEMDKKLIDAQQVFLTHFWSDIRDMLGQSGSNLEFEIDFGSPDLSRRLSFAKVQSKFGEPVTYSFPLGCEQHEAGTIPLGTMLNDNHEFLAVPGLHAAGPCTFPRTGAANPAMTILALGQRLGHKLTNA